jgi:Flp pilus assembly protein TadG
MSIRKYKFAAGIGRFGANHAGVAAVETALLLPVAFLVLGIAVFGGEGLGIQRKTMLAARSVADLIGQTSTTGSVNSTSSASINQSTLDYYLSLASLIVYPYDASGLKAEASEIQITAGASTGTVVWSEGYNGGTPRTVGQVIPLSSSLVAAGETDLILAETQYAYNPIGIGEAIGPMTITGSIYMIPRSASSISVNWGQ